MKMSDVFSLPMFMDGVSAVISNDHRYSIEFDDSDSNVGCQMELVCHAINNQDRLTEENAKLRHELANLTYMAENNTGNEPSLSCFHLAIDEAKQLLSELREQSNDK